MPALIELFRRFGLTSPEANHALSGKQLASFLAYDACST